MKYKVDFRLMDEGKLVAFKIYAGVYVFYITPELMKLSLEEGIVEDFDYDTLEELEWWGMTCLRGKCTEIRMNYALEHSTLEYLLETLEILENMEKEIEFDYVTCGNTQFSCKLNIETEKVDITNYSKHQLYENINNENYGYLQILDFMIRHMDREFMNSRNIVEKIKENDGQEPYNNTYIIFK